MVKAVAFRSPLFYLADFIDRFEEYRGLEGLQIVGKIKGANRNPRIPASPEFLSDIRENFCTYRVLQMMSDISIPGYIEHGEDDEYYSESQMRSDISCWGEQPELHIF